MTAAGTPASLDHSDDRGEPRTAEPDTASPGRSERPAATGGAPAAEVPPGSVEERPEAQDARVVALSSRSEPEGGRGRPGRRWVFHGEVETISGPEADRIRAELADVIRDLLLWAAGEASDGAIGDGGLEEEAA
ncbi:hypothetical protein E0F15_13435 [Frankia sp. B2]|uniref:hypothetical protein n=1 Tax=unclassified Frankia TaxID=2632575 RepID=UPI000872C568|nr:MULTISPECIES: hypothetical protein [unclassified Frankia]OFB43232.1 hypothetical protein Manayef4_12245 [Frankia sp. CgIM4]TFE29245.1 hypothetical protein E0F15_13435 [Frankia sp. B2]